MADEPLVRERLPALAAELEEGLRGLGRPDLAGQDVADERGVAHRRIFYRAATFLRSNTERVPRRRPSALSTRS